MMRKKNTNTVTVDGISLKPDPVSGNFSATIKVAGKYRRVGCGTKSEHEAYIVAKKKRDALEQQAIGSDGKEVITIEQACCDFLGHHKLHELFEPDTLKMFRTMTHRIQGYVLDHLTGERKSRDSKGRFVSGLYIIPGTPVHFLEQYEFDEYVDEMRKIYKSGTLRVFISRIKTMMVWLEDCGYAVPTIDWHKHSRQLPVSPLKSRPFTEDEVDRILAHLQAKKRFKHNYYKCLIALDCGFRISEICRLKVSDIFVLSREKSEWCGGRKRTRFERP